MCSEATARRILEGDRAKAIVKIVEGAWEAHLSENRLRTQRTRANIVWDYMVDFAERDLSGLPGVQKLEAHGSPYFTFDDKLILRFKKHNRELSTTNVRTQHQRAIDRQVPFSGFPEAVHVSCGYTLDRAEAGLDQVVVVKHLNGKLEWSIDMRELAAGVLIPTTPILPIDPNPVPLPTITSRRQEAEEAE